MGCAKKMGQPVLPMLAPEEGLYAQEAVASLQPQAVPCHHGAIMEFGHMARPDDLIELAREKSRQARDSLGPDFAHSRK
jgi:hypothetical protein